MSTDQNGENKLRRISGIRIVLCANSSMLQEYRSMIRCDLLLTT